MTSTRDDELGIDLLDLGPFIAGESHANFDLIRANHPVYWNDEPGDGAGFWSLTRYSDVRAAASDAARLSSDDGTQIVSRRVEGDGPHSLHNMDDPEHAKLRKITIPHLRAVKIQQWQEAIDSSVGGLLDDAQHLERFDFVDVIAARLPMLVLSQVMGVPAADAPKMVDWTNRLTSADPDATVDAAALAEARDEVTSYFTWLTEQRRARPEADLVSIIANAEKDGSLLTDGELMAYYILLVAAGNETTRHLLSGGVEALDLTPGAWDHLESEPAVLASAVEEMFRWVTPVACMRRTALEDHEISGTRIAAGDKVVLWFGSANRDPDMFADPHRFVPDRTPNDHLTFGWGIHFCLGAHLARAEIMGLFRETLRRGLRFEVAGAPTRLRHNLFRGITALPVQTRAGQG